MRHHGSSSGTHGLSRSEEWRLAAQSSKGESHTHISNLMTNQTIHYYKNWTQHLQQRGQIMMLTSGLRGDWVW